MATGRLLALRPESRGRARRALSLGNQGADPHTVAGYHPLDTDHSGTEHHTGHRPVAVHHHHSAPSVMGARARAALRASDAMREAERALV